MCPQTPTGVLACSGVSRATRQQRKPGGRLARSKRSARKGRGPTSVLHHQLGHFILLGAIASRAPPPTKHELWPGQTQGTWTGGCVCFSSTGPGRQPRCTGPVTRFMGAEHPPCMRCRYVEKGTLGRQGVVARGPQFQRQEEEVPCLVLKQGGGEMNKCMEKESV